MAPFNSSLGMDVDDEWLDFGWDGDVVEQEVEGRIAAPRWAVGRVLRARDVFCVYNPIAIF